jgi:hypothetical protein
MSDSPAIYIVIIFIVFICIIVVIFLWIQKLRSPGIIPAAPNYAKSGYGSRCIAVPSTIIGTSDQLLNKPTQFTPQPCGDGLSCVFGPGNASWGYCKKAIGTICNSVYECEPNATICNKVCGTGQPGSLNQPCIGGINCDLGLTCVSNISGGNTCLIPPGSNVHCTTTSDCSSGTCAVSSLDNLKYCISQLATGQPCQLNENCLSGNCSKSVGTINNGHLFCQPPGIVTGNNGALCYIYNQIPSSLNTIPQCEIGQSCYYNFIDPNPPIYGNCKAYTNIYPTPCSSQIGCAPPSICFNNYCQLPRTLVSAGYYYSPNSCDAVNSSGQCLTGMTQSTSSTTVGSGCLCKPDRGSLIPGNIQNNSNICGTGSSSAEWTILQWISPSTSANTIGSYLSVVPASIVGIKSNIVDFTSITRFNATTSTVYNIFLIYDGLSINMYYSFKNSTGIHAQIIPGGPIILNSNMQNVITYFDNNSTPSRQNGKINLGLPNHVRFTPAGNIVMSWSSSSPLFTTTMYVWENPINMSSGSPTLFNSLGGSSFAGIPFPYRDINGATVYPFNGSQLDINNLRLPMFNVGTQSSRIINSAGNLTGSIAIGYIDIDDRIGIRLVLTANVDSNNQGNVYVLTDSSITSVTTFNSIRQDADGNDVYGRLTRPCNDNSIQISNVTWVKLYTYGSNDVDSNHFLFHSSNSGYVRYSQGSTSIPLPDGTTYKPNCTLDTLNRPGGSVPPNGNIGSNQIVTDFNAYFDNGTFSSTATNPVSNAAIYLTQYEPSTPQIVTAHIQNNSIESAIPGYFPVTSNNLAPYTCISYPDISQAYKNFNPNSVISMYILSKTCI